MILFDMLYSTSESYKKSFTFYLIAHMYVCMCVLYQSVFGCSLPTLADNLALHLLIQLWYLILQGCVCVWGGGAAVYPSYLRA